MSSTMLGGDITANYLDENRQKLLEWTGSATGTRTMNEVYSAHGTLLDASPQGDDATMMTAENLVEYTIGAIDANDEDPWYIQYECVQHLTGGALKTAGWTRVTSSNTGIVVVAVTSNTMTNAADVGATVDNGTDTGTLLEVIEQGATDYLVIRPTDNTATHDWDTASGTINSSLSANSATQAAVAVTGEQVWANLYNVLPVDGDTHWYLYQGAVDGAARTRVADINDSTQDWWPEGAFDRCIFIRDFFTASNPVIDSGFITVFARKGNSLYDSFEVATSTVSGGRNPVALKPSPDGNNTTGYKSITVSGGSGNFAVGDEISGDVSGARGIITQIDNPGATATYHYYLIGDPQTDFNGSEAITNEDDTGAATGSGAVAAQGPALSTWFTSNTAPTISFTASQFDLDDDATAEPWAYTIDCNANPLTEVYEWCKYVTRNGETGTTNSDGIEGEQYVGPTVYLAYSVNDAGDLAEGDYVTQETSGATGIIVSMDETGATNYLTLRDTRGTFATHATLETLTNASTGSVEIDVAAETFGGTEVFTDAPLGRLAGGRWFGARGGRLLDWVAGDENSFQLIDVTGTERTRPIAIALSFSNLRGTAITDATADYAVMHRLTGAGGAIDKTEHNVTSGALGANTIVVDSAIPADVPGKSTGGVLNIRDVSDNNNHIRIRFASWTGSTFTLADMGTVVTTATTSATQVTYATGGFNANVQRGDLVYDITQGTGFYGYVETVDSDTQLTLQGAGITGLTTGNSIAINVNPVLLAGTDDLYVSLIDEYPTASSASVSIVYVAPIFFRGKVSNTRHTTKIKRFVTDDTTSGTDRNIAVIRNVDTIHT